MKSFYLTLGTALLASAVFGACTSDAPEEMAHHRIATPEPIVSVKDYDASLFPTPDNSKSLPTDGRGAMRTLLPKLDRNRCFDLSKVEITEEHYQAIKTFTDELLKNATTDAEKVTKVYDWVRTSIAYESVPHGNDAWSVFQNRKGICHGYSNMCRVMLYSQGIPCITVFGMLVNVGAHAWNYAYDGKKWVVIDATNSGFYDMAAVDTYRDLVPEMADIDFFEDDRFVYNYYEKQLNITRVKQADDVLVVPFSVEGIRVGMFNPKAALPKNVRTLYLGSNIKSLGESIIGLNAYPAFDTQAHVAPDNKSIGSEDGVVYRRDRHRKLSTLYYVPPYKPVVKVIPMEVVGKNLLTHHSVLEEVVFAEGTKKLEAYAIENCRNLRKVYVPQDCEVHPEAIYNCGEHWEIIRGNTTGIQRIR